MTSITFVPGTVITSAWLNSADDVIYNQVTYDAVRDFGADPTGLTDSTAALNNFCNAITDNSVALLRPGTYLYTPVIASGTGQCFLNIIGVNNWTLIADGVIIRNSFSVTTSPNNAGHLYGWNIQQCDDWEIRGLTFDGNRDTTFGTNGDSNEFYSAFSIRDCNRGKLIDCSGINCQGDGYTIEKIPFGTGCTDIEIIRGNWSRNRRNNGSISHNYGGRVYGGTYSDAGYGHGTNPQAMIDCEWEEATVPPVGNNTRMLIDGCDFSGVGVVGLYLPNTSGVTASNITCSMSTAGAAVTVDSTNVNYPTIDIRILGWNIRQTAGVNIVTSGGAGVSGVLVDHCTIYASQPIIVNTSDGIAGDRFAVTVTGCDLIGEGAYSIKVLSGRTKFHSNKCINSSSGSGNYYAIFRPLFCDVQGNEWERDNGQTAPTYGVIVSEPTTVFENNSINGVLPTHPIVYGENSTPAYFKARTNYRNGSLFPDIVSTWMWLSPSIDATSASPVLIYLPSNGLSKVIDAVLVVGKSGAAVSPTTKISLGIVGNTTKYLNALTLPVTQLGDSANIESNLSLTTFDASLPVFAQITTGNTAPVLNVSLLLGYDTSSLYTATVLFT